MCQSEEMKDSVESARQTGKKRRTTTTAEGETPCSGVPLCVCQLLAPVCDSGVLVVCSRYSLRSTPFV